MPFVAEIQSLNNMKKLQNWSAVRKREERTRWDLFLLWLGNDSGQLSGDGRTS